MEQTNAWGVIAVQKKANRFSRYILPILAILLTPFILIGLVLAGLSIFSEIRRFQIRNEIFSYVQENSDNIELTNSNSYQEFSYSTTGLQDCGVEYGYYYAPDDDYALHGEQYRNGYRIYGIPDDDTDWYYTERICENWFYYEIHDG